MRPPPRMHRFVYVGLENVSKDEKPYIFFENERIGIRILHSQNERIFSKKEQRAVSAQNEQILIFCGPFLSERLFYPHTVNERLTLRAMSRSFPLSE